MSIPGIELAPLFAAAAVEEALVEAESRELRASAHIINAKNPMTATSTPSIAVATIQNAPDGVSETERWGVGWYAVMALRHS